MQPARTRRVPTGTRRHHASGPGRLLCNLLEPGAYRRDEERADTMHPGLVGCYATCSHQVRTNWNAPTTRCVPQFTRNAPTPCIQGLVGCYATCSNQARTYWNAPTPCIRAWSVAMQPARTRCVPQGRGTHRHHASGPGRLLCNLLGHASGAGYAESDGFHYVGAIGALFARQVGDRPSHGSNSRGGAVR